MTNSETVTHSETIGTGDPTTPATDKFISNRGTEFTIETHPNGLFHIVMRAGGKPPSLVDEMFTSHQLAEKALIKYIRTREKPTGEAQYPGKKVKNAPSKV